MDQPGPGSSSHSCPMYTRSVAGRKKGDASRPIVKGSYDPSQIVTDCLDRHTGSHVARKDSGSELQVVYFYP